MTDALAEALALADQADADAARRRDAITRARQAKAQRRRLLDRDAELSRIDHLMRQPPGKH